MSDQLQVEAEKPENGSARVAVTDIRMPFWSMVIFMVKWAVASIPAMIILILAFWLVVLVGMMLFGGLALLGVGAAATTTSASSPPSRTASVETIARQDLESTLDEIWAGWEAELAPAAEPTPTPTPTPAPIAVELRLAAAVNPGGDMLISGTTNLPAGLRLRGEVRNEQRFVRDDSLRATVSSDGTFRFDPWRAHEGMPIPTGEYQVFVHARPGEQPSSVVGRIGDRGQYLDGDQLRRQENGERWVIASTTLRHPAN